MAHKIIESVVESIKRTSPKPGEWSISTDDLARHLDISYASFYQALYGLREKISLSDAIEGFGSGNVGDLITVLESIYGGEVESIMTSSGLFVPHELRIDLLESLISTVSRQIYEHLADLDTFQAMLDVCRTFNEAVETYYGEFFAIEDLINLSVLRNAGGNHVEEFFAGTASKYLRSLFDRHILDFRRLFSPVEAGLREFAYEKGYLSSRERTNFSDRGQELATRETAEALRAFGLAESELSAGTLKQRYKALMKRYHPDINPGGLEMCKRINVSYAMLGQAVGRAGPGD